MNTSAARGDGSFNNISLKAETPEAVNESHIQSCLDYIRQYRVDERLQSTSLTLRPKAESLWSTLPQFLLHRVRLRVSTEEEERLPNDDDLNKALTAFTGDKKNIDYCEFLSLWSTFSSSVQALFDPRDLWGKLMSESDAYGRLPMKTFRELIVNKIDLLRYRSSLESYSFTKPGYLTYDELSLFIKQIMECTDIFTEYMAYEESIVTTFTEMILFKAGSFFKDQVKITDILMCDAIAEIYEQSESSCFSLTEFSRLYNEFKAFAPDMKMTKTQLCAAFENVVPFFWDCYVKYYQPDDIIFFIDFYRIHYMMNNLLEHVVIRTLFKVMDVDGDGVFSIEDYRPFHEQLMPIFQNKYGGTFFSSDIIYHTLFDMALVQEKITANALIETKRFDEFFGMACNAYEFAKLEGLVGDAGDAAVDEPESEE